MLRKLLSLVLVLVLVLQMAAVRRAEASSYLCQLNLSGSATHMAEGMLASRLTDARLFHSRPIRLFQENLTKELKAREQELGRGLEYQDVREIFERNFVDLQMTLSQQNKNFGMLLRNTGLALIPLGIYIGLAQFKGDPAPIAAGLTGFVTLLMISVGTSVPAIANLKAWVANNFNRVALGKLPTSGNQYQEFNDRRAQRDAKYSETEQAGLGRTNAFQQQLTRNVATIIKWLEKGDVPNAGKVLGASAVEMFEFYNDFHLVEDYHVIGRVKEQMNVYWEPEIRLFAESQGVQQRKVLADLRSSALDYLYHHPRYGKDPKALLYFETFLNFWTLTL